MRFQNIKTNYMRSLVIHILVLLQIFSVLALKVIFSIRLRSLFDYIRVFVALVLMDITILFCQFYIYFFRA